MLQRPRDARTPDDRARSDASWTARHALSRGLWATGLWFGTSTLVLAGLTVVLTQLRVGMPSSLALLGLAALRYGRSAKLRGGTR